MKTFLAAVVALVVGFGAAYAIVSSQKEKALTAQQSALEAKWRAEKEALEAEMNGKRIPGKSRTVEKTVVVPNRRTAEEILQNLLTLKPAGTGRIAVIRKIVHELEDLAELKDEAVPAVRDFLARNEDLDYSEKPAEDENGGDRRWRPSWSRSSPPTEFTLPPSLRIGLFEVLEQIGSPAAEEALAQVLGTSGRAVEVACVVRMLETIAPGKYRDAAINAAKELLRNPLPIDNPNRLDQQAESYLYAILEMYKDNSFVADAGRQLVSADGKLDRNARDYLTKTQGEQAIPTLVDALKNKALTNEWDKASIAMHVLDYAGKNAQANALLTDIVLNPTVDLRMREGAVSSMDGRRDDRPTDPDLITGRIALLEQIKKGVTEDQLLRRITQTQKNLMDILDGKPVDDNNRFGGGPGRGRDRGGQTPQGTQGRTR